ncbi:MAG: G5 domain-containing protein [Oscillospiraceae bacterium]|nr:G5 domain-containing protein [Oscillospiraceae bacterium]
MQFSNKAKKLHRLMVSAVAAITFVGGLSALAIDRTQEGSLAENLSYETTVTETESISHNIIRRANLEMPKGVTVTVQEGSDGAKEVKYHIVYDNGVEVDRVALSSEVIYAPQDKIVEYGTAENMAVDVNNQNFQYKYVLECTATAYDPSPEENGGYGGMSATGVPLQKGVIAVDPKVIPLGSRVYIEALDGSWSYGYAVAADTGGAIKGNRVDLLFMTKGECYEFGRRKCRVYVL